MTDTLSLALDSASREDALLLPSEAWPPEGATMVISGVVYGDAKTAGSKWSGVVTRKDADGRKVPVKDERTGRWKTFTKDSSGDKGDSWRSDVRDAVVAVFGRDRELLAGGLALEYTVYRLRPKSHYRTGRNERILRDDAPRFPLAATGTAGGDVEKLVRAFNDALNKLVWADDGQIVDARSAKRYICRWSGERPRAEYRIWALDELG